MFCNHLQTQKQRFYNCICLWTQAGSRRQSTRNERIWKEERLTSSNRLLNWNENGNCWSTWRGINGDIFFLMVIFLNLRHLDQNSFNFIGSFLVLCRCAITKGRYTKDWQDTKEYPHHKKNTYKPTIVSARPRNTQFIFLISNNFRQRNRTNLL